SNLSREVKASPSRRSSIISRFISTLGTSVTSDLGNEVWEETVGSIVPVLKHKDYVDGDGPTQHLYRREWLAEVIIVYAIRGKNIFRFVTGWDLDRWGQTRDTLHEKALENLSALPWPKQVMGVRTKSGGHVIIVDTDDKLATSRLLHPDL